MSNIIKGNRVSRPQRFCRYIHRYCNQTSLNGYDYCIGHILEDKTAPFVQCSYVNPPNEMRCTNAAPISDKREKGSNILCSFHTKHALTKTQASHQKEKITEQCEAAACVDPRPSTLEQIEAELVDEPLAEKAYIEDFDNFCPEMPSDYLAHAGVFTEKEVVQIASDKIRRLQSLYLQELKFLTNQLKEIKRKFMAEIANPSSSDGPPIDPELFQAFVKHLQLSGHEKIIRHNSRMKQHGLSEAKNMKLCSYEKDGKKCIEEAITLTEFCKKHILLDAKQVLFKPCGFGNNCQKPILPYEDACCIHYHLDPSHPEAGLSSELSPGTKLAAATELAQPSARATELSPGAKLAVATKRVPATELAQPSARATELFPGTKRAPATELSPGTKLVAGTKRAPAAELATVTERGQATDPPLELETLAMMDDMASLGLSNLDPGPLFGLQQGLKQEPIDPDYGFLENILQLNPSSDLE